MLGWLLTFALLAGWRDADLSARADLKAGRLTEAENTWREAVARAETDKELDPGVVDCLIGLAQVNDKRGNFDESERLYELAMRTVEGTSGGDSAAFADRLPNLALLYRRHSKSQMSEVLLIRLVKIREKTAGRESKLVAQALETYAQFLTNESRGTEAVKLRERAHAIEQTLQLEKEESR
ncbi:MAG: tetratricopeptide repeat protein [Leptolyngbya sp.]|nr:tetratricopeptide repeat protein [Candidatus Melainabacteria bacterium]